MNIGNLISSFAGNKTVFKPENIFRKPKKVSVKKESPNVTLVQSKKL